MPQTALVRFNMYSKEAIYIYFEWPIVCSSFIFMLITLVVLWRLKKTAKIFDYLRYETVFILADCFCLALLPIYRCGSCFPHLSPALVCMVRKLFFSFGSQVAEQASIVLDIFASLSCLFMLNEQRGQLKSRFLALDPGKIAFITFVLSSLCVGYEFFKVNYNFNSIIVYVSNQTPVIFNSVQIKFI